ncbi:MAG: amino acid transporter [Micromonosporaceae bacterium]|nr:amino acid transporter [Micromonosporaceae bacterium]
MSFVIAGLGLGLSLIVAIGAQNAYLLRQGLRREHVTPVVIVCAASDVVLYVVGAAGFGTIATRVPWLIDVVRWAGAAFLIAYGALAARRALRSDGSALRPATEEATGSAGAAGSVTVARATSTRTVVIAALALTWLNPHVYLDTVFLAGSVAAAQGEGRWAFVLGASMASIGWFTALGYGARVLGRWLSTPRAWRVLDAVIAAVMVAIGISLIA